MGVKTISVTDTAYKLLQSVKSEDEDVSEAIIRVLKKKSSLVECAGLWGDILDESNCEGCYELREEEKMRVGNARFVVEIQKKTL